MTILLDRDDPAHLRDLARKLARAYGERWERLSLFSIAGWLRCACALVDRLLAGPWRGWAC